SSRRRHTRFSRDWSSDVCSSDLGLQVEPLAGRLRRAAVFAVDRVEARGVAGGGAHGLLAIALGGLHDLGGVALGLVDDAVAVGVGLVHGRRAVLFGALYVAERRGGLLWRVHASDLHLDDADARAPLVERLLHQV